MKYVLLMNTMRAGNRGAGEWPKEDREAHLGYWKELNRELARSGELVAVQGLAFPDQAKVVRAGKRGSRSRTASFRNPRSFWPGIGL